MHAFFVRNRRRLTLFAAGAGVISCASIVDTENRGANWGFVNASATVDAGGQFRTLLNGSFFVGSLVGIPDSRVANDQCGDDVYTPNPPQLGVTHIDAGPNVVTRLSGRVDTLVRITNGVAAPVYRRVDNVATPYRPGDTLVVEVKGAAGGYPAETLKAKTAEAFAIDSVVLPTAGSTAPIRLRWTAGDVNSAMVVSIRYASSGSTAQNRQVFCTFRDDGVDSITFQGYQPIQDNGVSARQVISYRLRTASLLRSTGSLVIVSTFQRPTPSSF